MSTIRRRVDEGEIPVVRIGRNIRVRPEDLEEYIETHVVEGLKAEA